MTAETAAQIVSSLRMLVWLLMGLTFVATFIAINAARNENVQILVATFAFIVVVPMAWVYFS